MVPPHKLCPERRGGHGNWYRKSQTKAQPTPTASRLTGLCPDHTGALDSNHRDRGQGGIEHVQVHSTVISPAVAGGK